MSGPDDELKAGVRTSPLFQGVGDEDLTSISGMAIRRALGSGEYLFLMGDRADRLFVVLRGTVDLCFPLAVGDDIKDVSVERVGVGGALGWSALVKPHRFTLAARAGESAEVAALSRSDLMALLEARPPLGLLVMKHVAQLVGLRLLTMQALWARGLQRELNGQVRDLSTAGEEGEQP